MARDRALNCLCGSLLALVAGFCAAMCLKSAFALQADWQTVLLWCALAAALCGISLYGKYGWAVLLGAAALSLWIFAEEVQIGFSGLLYEMTWRFDSAYGVGTVGTSQSAEGALTVIGCVVTLAVGWTVCNCTPVTPAVLVSIVPLLLCVVVTDTVPNPIWLAGVLFAVLEMILTGPLRLKHRGQGVYLTAYLAIPLLLGLVLLFTLVPQTGYDHRPTQIRAWLAAAVEDFPGAVRDLAADVAHRLDGTAREERVDLTAVGPKTLPTTPVMDVVTPQTGKIYLREQDYDYYTGTGWASSPDRQEEVTLTPEIPWVESGEVTISTRRSRELLFLPYYCSVDGTLANGGLENSEHLSAYTITQYTLPEGWKQAVTAQTYPPPAVDSQTSGNGDRYLQLPEGSREELEALAGEILSDEQSATAIALAIADYVEDSAYYSLDTPYMPAGEEDFALWFLNSSDSGYCVHFATATTVLLRAAGVECRYVTGYSVYAIAGQVTTVTAAQAHAWVEYYEPRLGIWLTLEPTPPDLGREPQTEPATTQPASEAPAQTQPTETTPPTQPEAPVQEKPAEKGSLLWLLWLIPAAIPVGLLLRRQILLRRFRSAGGPNETALALWQQIEAIDRALGRTPPEELEGLAQKACYSQHTLTGEELEIFTEYLLEAKALCRKKGWYRRLVWRYWDVLF